MKGLRREIPNEIRIKEDVWYKVRFKKDLLSEEECYGLCCSQKQEIQIATGITPQERIRTLLHELLHAIEFEYNMEIPHKLIHKLEEPLAFILLENTDLNWLNWEESSDD